VPAVPSLLEDLAEGPRPLIELRAAGSLPQTTMRGHLRDLTTIGVVEKHRSSGFSGGVDYSLTSTGHEFLGISKPLATWLSSAPRDDVTLGTAAAQRAIKALLAGWTAGMVRVLAARALSLTQLDRVVNSLGYPALERRLSAMRLVGLVEPASGNGRGTPYAATDWLRAAVAPLATAARWERLQLPRAAPPITARDVEAVFLLALPLAELPPAATGTCQLVVRSANRAGAPAAGVLAEIRDGVLHNTETRLEATADGQILGSSDAWFAALLDGDLGGLELVGDPALSGGVVEGLIQALMQPRMQDERIP
jgi:DNA-binding HxlR family transcriptional regulator